LSKRWSLIAQDQALQCHQPVAARTRRVAPADPTADLGIDRHVRLHASTQRLRPRQDSTIVVTLPPEFEGLTTADQVMAIAQLVIPHQNSDAEQLGFSLAERHIEAPVGDGRLVARPVTRQDYRRVAPP
jgi:hypothetical protein